jgi:predicted phosphodiesterase
MRVAVISDVHSNLHALEAARREIEREHPDEIWNLGDSVGYGPKPNECCQALERLATISLVGNHDLAAIGQLPLEEFSPVAARAALWTQEHLSDAARRYLEALAPESRAHGVALFHGSPREPVWAYVLRPVDAADAFYRTSEQVLLVGHSHFALTASLVDDRLDFEPAPGGMTVDLTRGRWLLNPGSIGQPRDGDPRAAYLLLDLDSGRAEFKRVEYSVERTQNDIRKARLPEQLASRLAHGV